ncbi:MAG: hypothetical protein PVG22_02095 [Chromatiales bacterium]|jgi:hypothetical protein
MCHYKTYKRLSDGALERIMRDVINGMQTFSSGLATSARSQSMPGEAASPPRTTPLPRFTSLCSEDLFGSIVKAD